MCSQGRHFKLPGHEIHICRRLRVKSTSQQATNIAASFLSPTSPPASETTGDEERHGTGEIPPTPPPTLSSGSTRQSSLLSTTFFSFLCLSQIFLPVAIIILQWNSENVLFQDFIAGDWPFYSFDRAESPPECQWAISKADSNFDELFWLQFSTCEQRARFKARFTLGREMAKLHHHNLHILLMSSFNMLLPPHDDLIVAGRSTESPTLRPRSSTDAAPTVDLATSTSAHVSPRIPSGAVAGGGQVTSEASWPHQV
ncbi:hypothetical protein LXA43DRAFT_1064022 [Ganoderma leucocontextum]|nr:hypothetical protein LXA43DRAFT_1064022 [Ganoderma leucocontextum]